MQTPQYSNRPTRQPDIQAKGRAWFIQNKSEVPEHQATISQWLVDTKGFGHPIWYWYVVACIHLRPMPRTPDAVIHRDGATHEIMFMAYDPSHPLPDLALTEAGRASLSLMNPPDLIHQFTVRSDEQAQRLTKAVVRHICEGQSPDVDFASLWRGLIDNTAEHVTYNGHPSDN